MLADETSSFPHRAAELRLGKIGRCLAQDLVGLAQLTVFPFQLLEPRKLIAGRSGPLPVVNLLAPHPFAQRFPPSSRSSMQSGTSPPIARHIPPDDPEPCAPHAHALPENIDSMSSSWLHLLKVRSLRQTRGSSQRRISQSRLLIWPCHGQAASVHLSSGSTHAAGRNSSSPSRSPFSSQRMRSSPAY